MISSITLGGLTMGTYASGYIFTSFDGFEFPDFVVEVMDRGIFNGADLGNYFYSKRNITISGMIIGTSKENFSARRRALFGAVKIDNGLQELQFTTKDGITLYTNVIVGSKIGATYQKGFVILCDFQLNFIAPYPFFRSAVKTSDLSVFVGGGGGIPMTIPFSLGVGGTGATTLTNSGNGVDYPTVVINGPLTNPSLRNDTTDKTLSINYSLGSSTDTITLDFYNRTALYNDSTNVFGYVSGDWWTLPAGDSVVKFTAASYDSNANAEFSYYDSYLGI
jgi:hypothetical protein